MSGYQHLVYTFSPSLVTAVTFRLYLLPYQVLTVPVIIGLDKRRVGNQPTTAYQVLTSTHLYLEISKYYIRTT